MLIVHFFCLGKEKNMPIYDLMGLHLPVYNSCQTGKVKSVPNFDELMSERHNSLFFNTLATHQTLIKCSSIHHFCDFTSHQMLIKNDVFRV